MRPLSTPLVPIRLSWPPALAIAIALGGPAALTQNLPPPASDAAESVPLHATPIFQPTSEDVGDALVLHHRYQAAIEAFKKAPPSSASALNKMGIAYQLMFNLRDAVRCYQAALKLEPANSNYLNNLGTAYDALHQYGDAERAYRRALKADPRSALASKNFGTSLLAQHRYKEGWERYQAALALDPGIFEDDSSAKVQNPASVQDRGAMNYYLAKGCVRAGLTGRALDHLRIALNEGFTNPQGIVADSEFSALRDLPEFRQLLQLQGNR